MDPYYQRSGPNSGWSEEPWWVVSSPAASPTELFGKVPCYGDDHYHTPYGDMRRLDQLSSQGMNHYYNNMQSVHQYHQYVPPAAYDGNIGEPGPVHMDVVPGGDNRHSYVARPNYHDNQVDSQGRSVLLPGSRPGHNRAGKTTPVSTYRSRRKAKNVLDLKLPVNGTISDEPNSASSAELTMGTVIGPELKAETTSQNVLDGPAADRLTRSKSASVVANMKSRDKIKDEKESTDFSSSNEGSNDGSHEGINEPSTSERTELRNIPLRPKFSLNEDVLILQLRNTEKLPWQAISKFFRKRSAKALQVHYSVCLKDQEQPWTPEEDEELCDLVQEHERAMWDIIAKRLDVKVGSVGCMARYRELQRQQHDELMAGVYALRNKEGEI